MSRPFSPEPRRSGGGFKVSSAVRDNGKPQAGGCRFCFATTSDKGGSYADGKKIALGASHAAGQRGCLCRRTDEGKTLRRDHRPGWRATGGDGGRRLLL